MVSWQKILKHHWANLQCEYCIIYIRRYRELVIGICDADEIFREKLFILCKGFFQRKDDVVEVLEFSSAKELVEHNEKLNLVFVGIESEGKDIRERCVLLSNILSRQENECSIIFLTEEKKEIHHSFFWGNICGLLPKKFEEETFNKCLDSFNEYYDEICIEDELVQLDKHNWERISKIIYIKAADKYCEIFTKDKKYLVTSKMCDLEKKLYYENFVRIQRSYIINFDYVVSFGKNIKMKDGAILTYSRGKRQELRKKYYNYKYLSK